jgi:hypothetical protein
MITPAANGQRNNITQALMNIARPQPQLAPPQFQPPANPMLAQSPTPGMPVPQAPPLSMPLSPGMPPQMPGQMPPQGLTPPGMPPQMPTQALPQGLPQGMPPPPMYQPGGAQKSLLQQGPPPADYLNRGY